MPRKPKPAPRRKAPAKPETRLTATQELVADLAGDLILYGGCDDDLDRLLMAVVRHQRRRQHDQDPSNEYIARTMDTWRRRLAADRLTKNAPTEQPEPKTFTERVRADVRNQLEDHLRNLIYGARPEEVRLLVDILDTWHSSALQMPDDDSAEIGLAEAMGFHLHEPNTFVQVPRDQVRVVEAVVNALKGRETEPAASAA